MVVGNKLDLHFNARHVSTEEGRQLAISWNAAFLETSAKDNTVGHRTFHFECISFQNILQNFVCHLLNVDDEMWRILGLTG